MIQGVPSGCGMQFVYVKLKDPLDYKLLILMCNYYYNVNKSLSSTRWTPLAENKIICIKAIPPRDEVIFFV